MEQVISYKDKQMGFLQEVERLKQEKAALVAEKVRIHDLVILGLLYLTRGDPSAGESGC